ncbi:hypothetical protein C1H46_005859 [Malus baccata]|uniref:Uncharacterized protein n=1 Tax=Malus baccata TaxID=106549 RepID=A0A540ND77_MALBA|nr:hypothetical protein C1H46_005859 [Malus baccata]
MKLGTWKAVSKDKKKAKLHEMSRELGIVHHVDGGSCGPEAVACGLERPYENPGRPDESDLTCRPVVRLSIDSQPPQS